MIRSAMMLQLLQVMTLVLSIIINGNLVFMSEGSYCDTYGGSSFNTSCIDYGLPIDPPFWISSGFGNPNDAECKAYPGFEVRCEGGKPVMNISNHLYYVRRIDSDYVTLVDVDVDGEECPRPRHNFSLQSQPFLHYYSSDSLTVFLNCTIAPPTAGSGSVEEIPCLENSYNNNNKTRRSYAFLTYVDWSTPRQLVNSAYAIPEAFHDWYNYCEESVAVPGYYYYPGSRNNAPAALQLQFNLTWSDPVDCDDCVGSGGQCSANHTTGGGIRCQCANGTKLENDICPDPQGVQAPQVPQGVQATVPQVMAPGRSSSRTSGSQPSQTGTDSPNGVGQPKKKGGRKRAQNLILREHLERGAPRPRIEIPVGKLRTLEDWSDQWVAELGIICKKNIPITAHCWKDVTIDQREVLYQKVLASFDVDMTQDHVVAAVNDSMKDRFKELRHSFHKHYLSIPDGSDKRVNCPKSMKQEDWEAICDWFESDEFKKMSTRNKANREKLKVNHRGGCKSFVRHRHEQKDPVTGEEQNRVDFYRTMHWNNTKGWVAPEALETYDKMLELRSQPVEENSRAMNDGEIADKVLGVRSGYVRGLGHGEVAPSRRVGVGVGTNQQEMNQLRTRAEEAERNLEELRNWRGTAEEASNTQQQMINTQQQQIDAQNQKLAEQEQFLNFLKAKFGFN